MDFIVVVQISDQLTPGACWKKICLVIFSLWSKLFQLSKFNDFFHPWLIKWVELIWTFFLLSSSLLYMPHDCSLLSFFPMDGHLAFSFEVHLTLFLFWTSLRQGLRTLIFFVWSKDFKENHGCQFFSAMTGLDILTMPTWQQFVAGRGGAQQSVENGIILLFVHTHVTAHG